MEVNLRNKTGNGIQKSLRKSVKSFVFAQTDVKIHKKTYQKQGGILDGKKGRFRAQEGDQGFRGGERDDPLWGPGKTACGHLKLSFSDRPFYGAVA